MSALDTPIESNAPSRCASENGASRETATNGLFASRSFSVSSWGSLPAELQPKAKVDSARASAGARRDGFIGNPFGGLGAEERRRRGAGGRDPDPRGEVRA